MALFKTSQRLVPGKWRQCQNVISLVGSCRTESTASFIPPECPFQQTPSPNVSENYKAYEEIPHQKGLPLVGTIPHILLSGGARKLHEYCHKRHQKLGPIFREKLGPVESVVISKKALIDQVYLNEGRCPVHFLPPAWVIYNELKGIKRGLFFREGEEWLDVRRALNPVFLDIGKVRREYGEAFNEVVTDTLNRWEEIRSQNDNRLPNLEEELYNYSMESLGCMIFGQRLGCIKPLNAPDQNHDYVRVIKQVFIESAKLTMIPAETAYKYNLPRWKRFEKAATNALEISRKYVEKMIDETKSIENPKGILPILMKIPNIDHNDVVSICADLVLASADTTSHAFQWGLYLVAKNPQYQQALLDEINSIVSPGEDISEKHLEKLVYASLIMKESLRMYPIAPFLTRVLPNDIVLGGYHIPAGKLISMSLFTTGQDPEPFENPSRFAPERWARDKSKQYEQRSHGCMPFGKGARSCLGKRVAEEQIKLLLSRVIQNYHVELKNKRDVKIALRMVTTPSRPIQIALHPRKK